MEFPLADFRLAFPEFADVPNDVVNATADLALGLADFGPSRNSGRIWQLMAAHLLSLRDEPGAAGGRSAASGTVASATIDKVSVSYVAPRETDAWSMALNSSEYGRLALAMLAACRRSTYIGGLPEGAAFTKVGGRRWR